MGSEADWGGPEGDVLQLEKSDMPASDGMQDVPIDGAICTQEPDVTDSEPPLVSPRRFTQSRLTDDPELANRIIEIQREAHSAACAGVTDALSIAVGANANISIWEQAGVLR